MKRTLLILTMIVGCLMISCNPDNNSSDNNDEEKYTVNPVIEANSSFLFGTTWEHDKLEHYDEKGKLEHTGTSYIDFTLTFTSELLKDNCYVLDINESYVPEMYTYWYVDENGLLTYFADGYASYLGYSAQQIGQWLGSGGFVYEATIIKNEDRLILKMNYDDGDYVLHYYTQK